MYSFNLYWLLGQYGLQITRKKMGEIRMKEKLEELLRIYDKIKESHLGCVNDDGLEVIQGRHLGYISCIEMVIDDLNQIIESEEK